MDIESIWYNSVTKYPSLLLWKIHWCPFSKILCKLNPQVLDQANFIRHHTSRPRRTISNMNFMKCLSLLTISLSQQKDLSFLQLGGGAKITSVGSSVGFLSWNINAVDHPVLNFFKKSLRSVLTVISVFKANLISVLREEKERFIIKCKSVFPTNDTNHCYQRPMSRWLWRWLWSSFWRQSELDTFNTRTDVFYCCLKDLCLTLYWWSVTHERLAAPKWSFSHLSHHTLRQSYLIWV